MNYSQPLIKYFNQALSSKAVAATGAIVVTSTDPDAQTKWQWQITLDQLSQRITDLNFKAYGTPAFLAAMAYVKTLLLHQPITTFATISADAIMHALQLTATQQGAAINVIQSLQSVAEKIREQTNV